MSAPFPSANLAFPVQLGGSKITAERVSGPPSKMYPMLRDLAEAGCRISLRLGEYEIRLEVDTEKARFSGTLISRSGPPTGPEALILRVGGSNERLEVSKIIAFRVLNVRLDD